MLNLVWLKTLVALFQYRNFQTTADRLGIAQPTVTQHVQKLEEQLQVGLVVRGRAGCQPTPEALLLLPFAESMLKLNDRAVRAIKGRDLRVGASSNIGIYMLPPYVRSFVTAEYNPDLELVIGSNPAIAQKLGNAELDVAVMEWWQPQTGFQVRSWRKEPLVLIVPPTHSYAELYEVGPEHLAGMELIGGESGTGTGRLLDRYFADKSAIPGVSMQLGSTEAVKQAVKAGLGVSLVLASAVTEEVGSGSLCAVPFSGAGLDKELMVVWRENPAKSDQLPGFVSHLLNESEVSSCTLATPEL
ncbi:LysR family transcriptional regulator [Pseudomonas neustonica]|jgi:DNA-binding transcriptional LysR family regulator|uniref:LysR family transcriptional regulator n=1 Tax=Pseudomonas neustonica TaxID=2487346 RepID=A0ABX9XCR3_9PSED|nr:MULTISPECIES: LysR family transcriptional regulator [Pseudomonas]ROZ79949.1 LysR family transcriptional regulator [Pseudomonas sp. SSM44]ROZ80540.1 LysR family transcriptional regulator [Pseudomonas neustonica]|tara:strand:+ start:1423 stop:2325 length:903 start_codon:yes stop_codon:yes gene_type:complete